MAYYTKQDFLYMSIRGLALPVLLIAKYGLLYGLIAYIMSQIAYYFVLSQAFGMNRLGALDEFFHLDNAKNRANIMVVIKSDRIEEEAYPSIIERMVEISSRFDRCQHGLKKFAGEYFFVPLKG
jgi:hypothetical protein